LEMVVEGITIGTTEGIMGGETSMLFTEEGC
jgi:hypothetical protein